ncbi:uncharacterized protein TRAVEDRAFT_32011 [Trametes versicolor FP-101664 SS1]|uniref:uncharacterized protein n=1 Tax=Trametes versicolor (strain FP-101664) TaxID=717944 RepID=UPI0004621FBB|nr:uncharacterized protein TRAVEDRAFT_32011 [Trametes versicolor FP-101664 SS1]EIW53137.1 hypothetical protein TRAVEDRAFT_32011 [Trametes versicolor FP-101664 SS1]
MQLLVRTLCQRARIQSPRSTVHPSASPRLLPRHVGPRPRGERTDRRPRPLVLGPRSTHTSTPQPEPASYTRRPGSAPEVSVDVDGGAHASPDSGSGSGSWGLGPWTCPRA